MRKSFTLAVAVLAIQLMTPLAHAEETRSCVSVTKSEIASLFDRWNASLQTKDPDKVVENYSEDAVLLPTVSNKPRMNHEEIRDYFEHFLQKGPKGKIDTSTIHVGCNDAFDVGTYTFVLTDKDGKVSEVAARYSYFYEFRDGKWLIAHHHSSAMPEKVSSGH